MHELRICSMKHYVTMNSASFYGTFDVAYIRSVKYETTQENTGISSGDLGNVQRMH